MVTRDTQGDPTKAVNAAQEMISQPHGPCRSGGRPIPGVAGVNADHGARQMPNIHPCVVDSLIDPASYPNAFRLAPVNIQWDDAVRSYT